MSFIETFLGKLEMLVSDKNAPGALLLLLASALSRFPTLLCTSSWSASPKSSENGEFQGRVQGTAFSWPGLPAYKVSLAVPTTFQWGQGKHFL